MIVVKQKAAERLAIFKKSLTESKLGKTKKKKRG